MIGMYLFEAHENQTALLAITVTFICAFEFAPGPIVWLYVSEICNDKATSIATNVNWFWTLVISVLSPYML